MQFQSRIFLAAALLVALAAFPAFAEGNSASIVGWGSSNGAGVPGPIAGAGLGYLVLAGGYYLVRRWRKQNTGE